MRPDVTRLLTVLVKELDGGAFVVQGYPSGVAAYVSAEDGTVLRQALDAAFESSGSVLDIPPIMRPRIWQRD